MSWLDWVWIGLGGATALAGLWLAVCSLVLDRSRGRKRCPKCWYDMSAHAHLPALVCPECGRDARSVKRLYKTRRRWKRGALGMSMVIVSLCGIHWVRVREAVADRGWVAAIPTAVLVWIVPVETRPFEDERDNGDWSTVQRRLHWEVSRRARSPSMLLSIVDWRQDRAIQHRGVRGIDPADSALVRRMFEARIRPIAGEMSVRNAFDLLGSRVGASVTVGDDVDTRRELALDATIRLPMIDEMEIEPGAMLDRILEYAERTGKWEKFRWDVADGAIVVQSLGAPAMRIGVHRYSLFTQRRYRLWHSYQKANAVLSTPRRSLGTLCYDDPFFYDELQMDLLREFVDTFGWRDNGGYRSRCWIGTNSLLIETTPRNHYEIEQFVDELTRRIPRDAQGNFVLPTDPKRVRVE